MLCIVAQVVHLHDRMTDDHLGSSLLLTTFALLVQLIPLLLLKPADQLWEVLPHQAHLD